MAFYQNQINKQKETQLNPLSNLTKVQQFKPKLNQQNREKEENLNAIGEKDRRERDYKQRVD